MLFFVYFLLKIYYTYNVVRGVIMGKNKNDIDSMDKQIDKLDKLISKLKERETKEDNHVIYIDRLVDDHIQRNKKKKEQDTKKIASINEINTAIEEEKEDTKKITKINIDEIEKKDKVVELEIKEDSTVENENYKIYYWIMLALVIFMVLFFIILLV